MRKKAIAAVGAALTAFLWSAFSWMVLPWHGWDMLRMNGNGRAMAHALRATVLEHGIYTFPVPPEPRDEGAMNLWRDAMNQGPFAFMMIKPGSTEINMARHLFILFLTQLVVAAVLVWLLDQFKSKSQRARVGLVTAVFFVGSWLALTPYWNFWFFPARMIFINIFDLTLTGALMALAATEIEKRVKI